MGQEEDHLATSLGHIAAYSSLVEDLEDLALVVGSVLMVDWTQVWVVSQIGSSLWEAHMICIHNFQVLLEALADKDGVVQETIHLEDLAQEASDQAVAALQEVVSEAVETSIRE